MKKAKTIIRLIINNYSAVISTMQPSLLYHPSVTGDKNFVANVLYNNTYKALRHVNVRRSEWTCFFCSVVFAPNT